MTDLTKLTITEALKGLKEKKFSAVELTKEYLNKMESCRELNAYVLETPEKALEQAKAADEKYKNGTNGALEGIPLGIKDLFCTRGIRTTACSHILDGFVPPYESTVTQKLLDAGAVFLGKLNMDEFAMGGSKSTADIFSGWCRMYGSMCLLMVTNVIFFKMLLSVLSTVPSGLDVFLWIVLILTLVKVARKADAIITRIGLNPAITGDSLGRPLPGALTYMVVRSAASHITKSVGKSAGGRGSGFSSGASPSGRGPRTGGPFGGGRFAGYTASGFYQKAQRQSAQQGAGERAYASHSDTVQTGGVQTASQEHSAASMSQSSSVIRQQTFTEGAKRNGAALHGTRQTPAPASPASRTLSDSVRTPDGRHGPAGTQAAASSTRISQANTQTTQSRSVTGQTVRNTTSITGQKPPAGTAGNTSPASEEGRHNASPPPAQTRYTQRPVQTVPKAAAQRAAARQTTLRAESPRPGPAGTTPPPSVPALTVEPRPGRNLSQARTAPFEQARQHDSVRQEPRTVGDGSARPMRGAVSVQHPGPAGNGANSREKAQSRPIAGARMSMPKTARTGGLSKPSVTEAMKGAGKKEKALTPSRKQRGKKHEGT